MTTQKYKSSFSWTKFTESFHVLFNSTWTVVFFGFHQIGLALLNLIIILIFIIVLMREYFAKEKISFILMIPYLSWSVYALVLNSALFLLN